MHLDTLNKAPLKKNLDGIRAQKENHLKFLIIRHEIEKITDIGEDPIFSVSYLFIRNFEFTFLFLLLKKKNWCISILLWDQLL